jgi:glutamate-ammonia-ligase adenylyltransferase
VASSLAGFVKYQESSAWTWEHMALTRARVIIGDADLTRRFENSVREILCRPRDSEKLLRDVAEMRERIERERKAKSIWDSKHLRGGLVDIEFLAQYLQLRHATETPEVLSPSTRRSFEKCRETGILSSEDAEQLIATYQLLCEIQGLLRLTAGGAFEEETASADLKIALARATGFIDFVQLKDSMLVQTSTCYEIYRNIIERPSSELAPAETL